MLISLQLHQRSPLKTLDELIEVASLFGNTLSHHCSLVTV
jgi:hypothetical protein